MTRLITSLGIITLLHSAYSCLHYRSILTSSSIDETDFNLDPSKPPHDVVIECMIGFALCLVGQILGAGEFLPIVGEGRREVKAAAHVGRDFDVFCTRAGIIASVKRD
jgi:hypothetical protein